MKRIVGLLVLLTLLVPVFAQETATPEPAFTPTPTETPTVFPTLTETPTETATLLPTETETATLSSTETASPTPSTSATLGEVSSTETPTLTPTSWVTETATVTPDTDLIPFELTIPSLPFSAAVPSDVVIELRVFFSNGTLDIALRDSGLGGYRVLLRDDNQIGIFRDADLLGVIATSNLPNVEHTVRFSVIGGNLNFALDGVELFTYSDVAPLLGGNMRVAATGATTASAVVLGAWTVMGSGVTATATYIPTATILPTMTPSVTPVLSLELESANSEFQAQSFSALSASSVVDIHYYMNPTTFSIPEIQTCSPTNIRRIYHLESGTYTVPVLIRIDCPLRTLVITGDENEVIFTRPNPCVSCIRFMDVNTDSTVILDNIQVKDFSYNTASAINNVGGILYITRSRFENNTTTGIGTISVKSANNNPQRGVLKIWNTTFINNTAEGVGGAIAVQNNGRLTVQCTTFNNNRAFAGGAISAYADGAFGNPINFEITVKNSNFINNQANYTYGVSNSGAIYNSMVTPIIDARNNWWNATPPPTNLNDSADDSRVNRTSPRTSVYNWQANPCVVDAEAQVPVDTKCQAFTDYFSGAVVQPPDWKRLTGDYGLTEKYNCLKVFIKIIFIAINHETNDATYLSMYQTSQLEGEQFVKSGFNRQIGVNEADPIQSANGDLYYIFARSIINGIIDNYAISNENPMRYFARSFNSTVSNGNNWIGLADIATFCGGNLTVIQAGIADSCLDLVWFNNLLDSNNGDLKQKYNQLEPTILKAIFDEATNIYDITQMAINAKSGNRIWNLGSGSNTCIRGQNVVKTNINTINFPYISITGSQAQIAFNTTMTDINSFTWERVEFIDCTTNAPIIANGRAQVDSFPIKKTCAGSNETLAQFYNRHIRNLYWQTPYNSLIAGQNINPINRDKILVGMNQNSIHIHGLAVGRDNGIVALTWTTFRFERTQKYFANGNVPYEYPVTNPVTFNEFVANDQLGFIAPIPC